MIEKFANNIFYAVYGSALVYFTIFGVDKILSALLKTDKNLSLKPLLRNLIEQSKICRRLVNCAHRGGKFLAPDNTLFAFEQCAAMGYADFIEMDLIGTKDNKIAIIHDDGLDFTTDGKGLVQEHTLDELKALDAGYSFSVFDEEKNITTYPFRGKGLKVPTLDETFNRLKDYKNRKGEPLNFFLDFKTINIIDEALKTVEKYGLEDRVIIGAYDYQVNKVLSEKNKEKLPISVDSYTMVKIIIFQKLGLLRFFPLKHDVYGSPVEFYGIYPITKSLVKELQQRNKFFAVIGDKMDEERTIRKMVNMEIDFLFSGKPQLLSQLIDESSNN